MIKRLMAAAIAAALLVCACTACGAKDDEAVSSADEPVSSAESTIEEEPEVIDTYYRPAEKQDSDKTLKMLCVGDSLTFGQGCLSGYRYPLFERLYAAGVTFRFVGPYESTRDYRLTSDYNRHGGISGRRIQDVIDNFSEFSASDFDVVVLMIGYNDKSDIINQFDNYDKLVNMFYSVNPDATVFCSAVAPDQGGSGSFIGFNQHIQELCTQLSGDGKSAYYMPMDGKFNNETCYTDYVHFNEEGNKIIADSMAKVMTDVLLGLNGSGVASEQPVRVSGITLDKTELTLNLYDNYSDGAFLSAVTAPDDAQIQNILWSSSDESIVGVTDNGRVYAKKAGTCTVTAKTLDGGFKAECTVTVDNKRGEKYDTVFAGAFTADKWNGDASLFSAETFMTTWKNNSAKQTATTVDSFDATDKFYLSFNVNCYQSEYPSRPGNFVSLDFAGLSLRVEDNSRSVSLMYNGQSLGSFTTPYYSVESLTYSLCYDNGSITVLYAGIPVITANQKVNGSSQIAVVNNEIGRSVTVKAVRYLVLSGNAQ